jgi:urocanate hydratase
MSGAQAKAAVIAGAVCLVAEINPIAAHKRHDQGWVDVITDDVDDAINRMISASENKLAKSIGYIGNIVDVWERLVQREIHVDLGSDQTSLHNPFQGGYFPVDMTLDESKRMMSNHPQKFKDSVENSLRRHSAAINTLSESGMYFWDYGNAFLLECSRAGADIVNDDGRFRYPSYVEDIMGPMCFDYGFGPFRWVCCSGDSEDLSTTDEIAATVLQKIALDCDAQIQQQMLDNVEWITEAASHSLVVGSQARILYANDIGRREIAESFNQAIADGRISAPIVLGRDHHDVGGTDSPYRETANITDGSMFTADMAIQNFVGDSFRGATWVSIHNGGGVGWGEVINGGFGLLLDGSPEASEKIQSMLSWDVNNGVARRAWARNSGAEYAAEQAMINNDQINITLPHHASDVLLDKALRF